MRTVDLRRRLEVLNELGLLSILLGAKVADPVQAASMYLPPFRERLVDGRLGPPYGTLVPSRWHRAWSNWRASRAGGGLWDEETAWQSRPRRSDPVALPAPAILEIEEFLSRYGHRFSERELEVASLRWRDKLKPPAIAKRTGLRPADVEGILRVVARAWAMNSCSSAA